jgi:lipopolysaccharide export system protein LptC
MSKPDVLPAPPPPARSPLLWRRRATDSFTSYLPLVVMGVLALATWWLVKNTPLFDAERPVSVPRHEADYTMTQFVVQRFAVDGSLRAQIEGDVMRHFPDTDTIEVDHPRIRAFGLDRRVTTATANHALANRDGSELQLMGNAHVVREASATDQEIDFRGEFLHAFQYTEQIRSHLPVVVTQGRTEIHADSMAYDNLARLLDLRGHLRAVLTPPSRDRK